VAWRKRFVEMVARGRVGIVGRGRAAETGLERVGRWRRVLALPLAIRHRARCDWRIVRGTRGWYRASHPCRRR
jgi:hypothetical protein